MNHNKNLFRSKIEELSKSAINERISEISRESDTVEEKVNGKITEVIQIETEMPGRSFYSAHIFEKEKAKLYQSSINS